MDSDHVATLCLAHWPGQASPWIDDLRRIARYCSALGKWVTVDEYFAKTDQPGQLDRFEADRYRSPYLKQAIIRKQDDPISTHGSLLASSGRQRAAAEAMETLAATGDGKESGDRDQGIEEHRRRRPSQVCRCITAAQHLIGGCNSVEFTRTPPRLPVINPCSFVRRMGVEGLELSGLPTIERPVYAADEHAGAQHAVVDVPAFGFVHLTPGKPAPRDKKDAAAGRRQAFCGMSSSRRSSIRRRARWPRSTNTSRAATGSRSSSPCACRRQSKSRAIRYRDPDESAVYTVMAADSVETTIATTTLGEIVTRGRLLDAKRQ